MIDALLDECDALAPLSARLPARPPTGVRNWRLRLETAVIVGLAGRLSRRLRRQDPVAGRVKLTRTDVAASLLGAVL